MRTVAALCRELSAGARTDGELLARFLADPDDGAFAELLRRHGPLVWGACRRLLPDHADAEDAFQAAFLVLVRRAPRLVGSAALGPWLHRVAVWTARNVRRKNARRLARQHPLPDLPAGPAEDGDLKADIDAALLAVPTRYRDAIVLCYLQGYSRREAADRLGCAEGTLSTLLSRGLAKLRHRLRGLDPARALAAAAVGVPVALAASTARAATASTLAAATVPPAVTSLVEGVLHMFWVKKATAAAVALCAVFALGVGVGLGARTDHAGAGAREKSADVPAGEPKSAPATPDRPKPEAPTPVQKAEQVAKLTAELEELQRRLAEGEDKLAVRKRQAVALGAQIKNAQERGEKPDAAALDELIRLERLCEDATQECLVLRARIRSLEDRLAALARQEKPRPEEPKEPPKPVPPPFENLFGDPAELERLLREAEEKNQLERFRLRLTLAQLQLDEKQKGQPDEKAKAAVEKAQASLKLLEVDLQALRNRLAAAKAIRTPPLDAAGACIEVVVVTATDPLVCRVREYGRNGVPGGAVLTEDARSLELILTRAMKDPGGPRDFCLVVTARHSPEAILRAARAGKTAGYTKVRLYGTVPDGLKLPDEARRDFNGTVFDLSKVVP